MKRKVIQIAESTQLISLPRKWCLANSIKKGDELDVEPQGKKIIIATTHEPEVERITLDTDQFGTFALRSIAALYKSGFDEVEVTFKSPANLELLPKFLNEDLPGFEVFDHTANRYLVKAISKETIDEFDPAIRRIFIMATSMARNLAEVLSTAPYDIQKVNNTMAMDATINRLCNFCQRLLNKNGYKQPRKTSFIYTIIWEIEKLCDELKYICLYLKDHPKANFGKESVEMFNDAVKMFELFYNEFYKFNKANVSVIADTRKKIITKAFQLLDKGKDASLVHHTIVFTQMTFNMQGSLMGLIF